MTRTLRISDLICGECFTAYDTIEEAAECEREDILDEGERARQEERDLEFWALAEHDSEYIELYGDPEADALKGA